MKLEINIYAKQHLVKIAAIHNKFNSKMTIASNFTKECNNAGYRTYLFMLEAIFRVLYKSELNNKKITNMYTQIKSLEDAFGKLDYFLGAHSHFKKTTKEVYFTKFITGNIALQYKSVYNTLNQLGWLDFTKKYKEILLAIDSVTISEQDLFTLLKKHIRKELNETQTFFNDIKKWTNVEEQVHEIRRKLRWTSIYTKAFEGLFILEPKEKYNDSYKKYLTKEIIQSPFNNIVPNKNIKQHISIKYPNFLALSYTINELGKLKDTGLMHEMQNTFLTTKMSKTKSEKNIDHQKIILEKSAALLHTFFTTDLIVKKIRKNIKKEGLKI